MKFREKVKLDLSQVTDRSAGRRRHIGYSKPGTVIRPEGGNAQTGKKPKKTGATSIIFGKGYGKKPTDKIKPTPAVKKKKKK